MSVINEMRTLLKNRRLFWMTRREQSVAQGDAKAVAEAEATLAEIDAIETALLQA
jgi:hypothetical protein